MVEMRPQAAKGLTSAVAHWKTITAISLLPVSVAGAVALSNGSFVKHNDQAQAEAQKIAQTVSAEQANDDPYLQAKNLQTIQNGGLAANDALKDAFASLDSARANVSADQDETLEKARASLEEGQVKLETQLAQLQQQVRSEKEDTLNRKMDDSRKQLNDSMEKAKDTLSQAQPTADAQSALVLEQAKESIGRAQAKIASQRHSHGKNKQDGDSRSFQRGISVPEYYSSIGLTAPSPAAAPPPAPAAPVISLPVPPTVSTTVVPTTLPVDPPPAPLPADTTPH